MHFSSFTAFDVGASCARTVRAIFGALLWGYDYGKMQ